MINELESPVTITEIGSKFLSYQLHEGLELDFDWKDVYCRALSTSTALNLGSQRISQSYLKLSLHGATLGLQDFDFLRSLLRVSYRGVLGALRDFDELSHDIVDISLKRLGDENCLQLFLTDLSSSVSGLLQDFTVAVESDFEHLYGQPGLTIYDHLGSEKGRLESVSVGAAPLPFLLQIYAPKIRTDIPRYSEYFVVPRGRGDSPPSPVKEQPIGPERGSQKKGSDTDRPTNLSSPGETILESFEGFVTEVDGAIAYVTLESPDGEVLYGQYQASELFARGIRERRRFRCRTVKTATGVRVELEALPEEEISERLEQEIWDRIARSLGDDDDDNDNDSQV